MKAGHNALRRGFTLVELMVAMAITAVLVTIIMELTSQGISLWRAVEQDVQTSARARVALQTIAHDLESFQMNGGGNQYQWFSSRVDKSEGAENVDQLDIPRPVRLLFFACAPDRNPSVSSNTALRRNYRRERAGNRDTQGDVNAIAYRLRYRDHILNKDARSIEEGAFPVFSLYRQVITPRETYENLLGSKDLDKAYKRYEREEEKSFLCEYILSMSMIANIEYSNDKADAKSGRVTYQTVAVPVISTKGGAKDLKVYGDRIVVGEKTYYNARIVSIDVSITVLTEEGVSLIEQIRLGRRRAPKPDAFYAGYTRSFSRTILMPQPM